MFNAAYAVRRTLKSKFPRTRFSVRTVLTYSRHYWLNADLSIVWKDGPSVEEVHQLLNTFRESRVYNRFHSRPADDLVLFDRNVSPYLDYNP